MANIKISDLHPAGANFFLDSESYMHELTDDDLYTTRGGSVTTLAATLTSPACAIGAAITMSAVALAVGLANRPPK